jgi:hypothetical protein
VVSEGLGESEEGIKDIFPLSFPHCFYLCLLELGGERKGELGRESLKERTKRSLEELEGESKEELGGEQRQPSISTFNLQDSRVKEVSPNANSLISLG